MRQEDWACKARSNGAPRFNALEESTLHCGVSPRARASGDALRLHLSRSEHGLKNCDHGWALRFCCCSGGSRGAAEGIARAPAAVLSARGTQLIGTEGEPDSGPK